MGKNRITRNGASFALAPGGLLVTFNSTRLTPMPGLYSGL